MKNFVGRLYHKAGRTLLKILLWVGLEARRRRAPIPSFRSWLSHQIASIDFTTSENVLEIGPGYWSVPREVAIAAGANYFSVDPNSDSKPTLVGSFKDISKFGIQFDTILLFETLEHVAETSEICQAVFANLKPGGRLFGSVPFKKELHGENYGDYYRFTRQGLRFVWKEFATLQISSLGDDDFPVAYFFQASKAL